MGSSNVDRVAAGAVLPSVHRAALDKNCGAVDAAFARANINATSNEFGEPLNVLKGQYVLLRKDAGLSMGGSPVTLANFFTPNLIIRVLSSDGAHRGVANCWRCRWQLWCDQSDRRPAVPRFPAADLERSQPADFVCVERYQRMLQGTYRVDAWPRTAAVNAVSALLMRSNVINEWTINQANGAESYWVISFPTKLHYVDPGAQPSQAEINAMIGTRRQPCQYPAFIGTPAAPPALTLPAPPFTSIATFNPATGRTQSCDTVTFSLYDRAEGSVTATGTSISPAPPVPPAALCWEVNVLSFSPTANLLKSEVAQAIDVSTLVSKAPYGWLDVVMPSANPANSITATNTFIGLPVKGIALWSRDFGVAANNYGHLVDHSYRRNITP